MDDIIRQILDLLRENAKLTPEEIAIMLNIDVVEVRGIIKDLEDNKSILSYQTMINWEKIGEEKVIALIEVRITPQRDVGFDAIAERIYRFPEVRSMHLMSGTYDLAIFVEGSSMKEIAHFVATKLATIEGVVSTASYFVLKTFYAFPQISATGLNCEEFAEELLKQEQVALVPGNAFGPSGEGFVRVSYAASLDDLSEAFRRVGRFVRRLGVRPKIMSTPAQMSNGQSA